MAREHQEAASGLVCAADRQLPAFAWAAYRATLAAHVSDYAWRFVSSAYKGADAANWHVIELEREFDSPGPIPFQDVEWLREPFRTVLHAMEALEQELGPGAGSFMYTGYASIEDIEARDFPPEP